MKVPNVRDFMNTQAVTLRPDMRMSQAITLLLKHKITGATVVDEEGKLLGVLSEKDCLRIFANGAYNLLPGGVVAQYMCREVKTISIDADLFTAADIFIKSSFRRLPVIDEQGKFLGQVSRRDVLKGSREIWSKVPVEKEKQWTDAKYLTDEIKAALGSSGPTSR
jgi:CBS domain-containing protein